MGKFILKAKLIVMNFLQFAIWGSYLTTLGNFLASKDYAKYIGYFYASQGIVSMFFPSLLGIVADSWIQAQHLYIISHFLCGLSMLATGYFALGSVQIIPMYISFFIAIGFYMASLSLSYAVAYNALEKNGLDTVKSFPPIRFFGTVGFIVTMWIVDLLGYKEGPQQFFISGGLNLVLAVFAFVIPKCEIDPNQVKKSLVSRMGLDALKLFTDTKMAVFFIFSMFLGVCLQITNSYANPYVSSFQDIKEYENTFGAKHASILISLSQISEALCILLIPFFLKRFGIKNVLLIAMIAWVLRFSLFGLGNPGNGLILFIISCIVYGVAFDFFNISGSLFVDKETDESIRSSAQGLFMFMTNGVGATIGTLGAQVVINHYVYDEKIADDKLAVWKGWRISWYIFAAYALIIAIVFALLFRYRKEDEKLTDDEKKAQEVAKAAEIEAGDRKSVV